MQPTKIADNLWYYLQDNDGDENYHIYLVDLNSLSVEELTSGKDLKVFDVYSLNNQYFIDGIKKYKDKIYVIHNGEDASNTKSYLYDIKTKEIEHLESFVNLEHGALLNKETLLFKYKMQTTIGYTLYKKDGEVIKKVKSSDDFQIFDFTSNKEDEIYVLSNISRDKIGLFKANLNLNIISDCLFENNDVDIDSIMVNYETKKLEKAIYYEDKPIIHIFSNELKEKNKLYKQKLFQKFPNEKKSIVSANEVLNSDKNLILINTHSDKKPIDEYLYNIKKDEIIKFSNDYKYFNDKYMCDMKPISYVARDGLKIHGYLTLPKNAKFPIPFIVNPHGGPWTRDVWRFNREVQFFANRGFGVFQPNFRISRGYGKNHFIKGWKEWGLKCQDDITDGTNFLIENDYTKQGQIAIYGASYGGYATLMGIIREPKLYSAAISYVGVSNLFTFWDGLPPYWKSKGNIFEEAMGNPYDNVDFFKNVSPFYRADEIETPLFVAQGANDPRVPKLESDQIIDSLRKRGQKVEYMVKEDEGHGFFNQENKFDLYEKAIKFLNLHIGKK